MTVDFIEQLANGIKILTSSTADLELKVYSLNLDFITIEMLFLLSKIIVPKLEPYFLPKSNRLIKYRDFLMLDSS